MVCREEAECRSSPLAKGKPWMSRLMHHNSRRYEDFLQEGRHIEPARLLDLSQERM